MTKRSFILPVVLSAQAIYCWWCFLTAKQLPYDDNYGILIHAFFISMAAWVFIRMAKAKWFGPLALPAVFFWIWFAAASPITFIAAALFYAKLFGSLAN